MNTNKIEGIQSIRLLDGVVEFSNVNNKKFKPLVNSVVNKTAGFTLELSDTGKYIRINNSDTVSVIIPNLPFPIGATITFEQAGAGAITISGSGVTCNGYQMSNGQYTCMQIIKVEDSAWTIIGGIEGV